MKMRRSHHFGLILLLFALISVFHYIEQIGIVHTAEPSYHLGLTRHALDRILFLLPIIYCGFVFGLVAGLAISCAAFLVMLPRAISISPAVGDAVFESIGVLMVGALVCYAAWTRTKRKEELQAALTELESAHQLLQHYVRTARSNEKRLATLNAISDVLTESLELRTILNRAVHIVMDLMDVEVVLMYSLDDETQELVLLAHEGVSEEFAQAVDRMKVGEGFNGGVALTGQPAVVEDASADPRLTRSEVRQMKIQSQLIVPMTLRDRVRGTLCVAMRRPRKFLPAEAEVLSTVATQIATAIENALLYEKEKRMQENLRYYLSQITGAQEEERKRIARELHDDTAQALYALSRQVDNFLRSGTDLPENYAALLKDLREQMTEVLQGVRRFSQDLRPPMIDDLGLLPAVRWLISETEQLVEIEIGFTLSGAERRFSSEVELTLFRAIQEALRNVWKHAGASKAEVAIAFNEGSVRVTVSDNGKGFEPSEKTESLARMGKLGLVGIEERMRLLGGSLKVESAPGRGTTLIAEAPI